MRQTQAQRLWPIVPLQGRLQVDTMRIVARGTRRRVSVITAQDQSPRGRPVLYGYGRGYLSAIAGVTRQSIKRAIYDRGIPLHDPIEAVAWALSKHGRKDLADSVLVTLGRKPRYRVEREPGSTSLHADQKVG